MTRGVYSFERRSALNKGSNNPMFGRCGKKSPVWKGDTLQYAYQHRWMRVKFGKPVKCEHCTVIGETKNGRWTIQYANKSGKYLRRRSDWLTVCQTCHRKHDRKLKLTVNKKMS